jgi:hypothetical protein
MNANVYSSNVFSYAARPFLMIFSTQEIDEDVVK